jgi:glutathione synthase/RimK-type ligase-like ATP-grasp enzyme
VESISPDQAPSGLLKTALKATSLIGKSLYGVDMKEVDGKFYVIEINDNPNIDAGVEDKILKEKLYSTIMDVFLNKIKSDK